MAGQDNISCYSCEGTLLVPTVDDRVSHWRERLVSGNRLTIMLKVVGQRWSSDACFFLWGENYLQEKVFEVNLRYVRAYFVRTRTWHEITASDRRRFALNFQDSNQFARFFEELESTLSFLKKLKTTKETSDDAGGIVVLRVDKLPPPKPPRAVERTPSSAEAHTPPLDEHRVSDFDRQPQYPELISRAIRRSGSSETGEDVADVISEEHTTKWYVNIYDGVTAIPPPISKRSDNFAGIYETIADPASNPTNHNGSNTYEDIETYDNISDVPDNHPCATKPSAACNNLSHEGNSRVVQSRNPASRIPIEAHVYDDRDSYDNITLDFNSQSVAPKSKPRLPPRRNELTGNKTTSGVTNDANRQPNTTPETVTAKPQPLPRTKKSKEDRSPGDAWTCHLCTLINPSTVNRCAACDKERHGSRDPPVTGSRDNANDAIQRLPSAYIVPSACFLSLTENEQWTCSVCSAKNRREADACHSCSAWICSHCTLHNQPELWVCSVCSHSRLLSKGEL